MNGNKGILIGAAIAVVLAFLIGYSMRGKPEAATTMEAPAAEADKSGGGKKRISGSDLGGMRDEGAQDKAPGITGQGAGKVWDLNDPKQAAEAQAEIAAHDSANPANRANITQFGVGTQTGGWLNPDHPWTNLAPAQRLEKIMEFAKQANLGEDQIRQLQQTTEACYGMVQDARSRHQAGSLPDADYDNQMEMVGGKCNTGLNGSLGQSQFNAFQQFAAGQK